METKPVLCLLFCLIPGLWFVVDQSSVSRFWGCCWEKTVQPQQVSNFWVSLAFSGHRVITDSSASCASTEYEVRIQYVSTEAPLVVLVQSTENMTDQFPSHRHLFTHPVLLAPGLSFIASFVASSTHANHFSSFVNAGFVAPLSCFILSTLGPQPLGTRSLSLTYSWTTDCVRNHLVVGGALIDPFPRVISLPDSHLIL